MLQKFWVFVAVAAGLLSSAALAQEVERAPTPAWVHSTGTDEQAPPVDGAPIRVLTMTQQIRFGHDGVDTYSLRRIRIQSAQGLGMLSTVSAVWSPPRETVQVHAVRILRGDEVIDVLDGQEFQTLRRENNLESSMLDGMLTATLQPRDLRVGDILETAFTVHDDGGVLAPHREMLDSLNSGLAIDQYSLRAIWPADMSIRAQGIGSWSDVEPRRTRDGWALDIERRDLQPVRRPDDLPARYYFDRIIQLTDFSDWADASALMAPLYERAATLEDASPLAAEIERIRAANPTDTSRAAAALRLVQDQVRYVALSMGEGSYVPASADDVWRSRYGDCKGKTALLLALLHGLGIEAEGALVSTRLGDGLDQRLPLISWFDHIIVRATIDGRTYWLDGTRTGDTDLMSLTPPGFHWALPVRARAATLEAIVVPPTDRPVTDITIMMDASAGLDVPAKVELDMALTGDAATAMRQSVSVIPPEQLQAMLTASFKSEDDTLEVTGVTSRYDEDDHSFHFLMTGTLRMAWVAGSGGRLLVIEESALYSPVQAERNELFADFKDAPYLNAYPTATRMRSRIILPGGGQGFRLEGGDQTVETAGYRLERTARLADGMAEVVITSTSLKPEVSAEEMKAGRTRNEGLSNASIRLRAPAAYRPTEADRMRMEAGDSDVADLIERAEGLSNAEDAEGALALLDAAIEKDPDSLPARLARGEAYLNKGDLEAARQDFDHAADLDPAEVKAALGQGRTALQDGRGPDAVVSYSVALRLEPSDSTALWGRANAYYLMGRWDRALQDYRALKTADPELSVGPSGELLALTRLERYDEAGAIIEKRLEDSPTDMIALNARLRLAKRQGQPEAALPVLDAAVEAAPENARILALRAGTRGLSGDEAGARSDFALLRSRAGTDPVLLNNLCWTQATTGFDLHTALADCNAAVAGAEEASFIDSRAMVLLQLERYAEAKVAYDQALAHEPNQSPSLYGRGLARRAMGDAGGQADIDRARALNADVAYNFEPFTKRHPDLAP